MTALIGFLSVVLVLLCAVVVFLILGQDVRGGGLAGALGGGAAQSAFGSKTTETVLKMTAYLALLVFVVVIVLIRLHAMELEGITSGPQPTATSSEEPGDATPPTPPEPGEPSTTP